MYGAGYSLSVVDSKQTDLWTLTISWQLVSYNAGLNHTICEMWVYTDKKRKHKNSFGKSVQEKNTYTDCYSILLNKILGTVNRESYNRS